MRRAPLGLWVVWLVATAATLPASERTAKLEQTSCVVCHTDADWFDEASLEIAHDFQGDVHSQVGLSCHDCHGGNPALELAEDLDLAMDEGWEANPYVGAPGRAGQPGFCARCHSDPVYMKAFKPDARVDQEAEYRTSHHGRALARGDEGVAVCTDCHGVHGILRAVDPLSPVYPTHVAETCSRCHSDPDRMQDRGLGLDQFARWRQSVHAIALLDREDLSAPTCNDCHGNHGAAPPGLASVAFVCGQCHGREAELFRASAKHDLQADHNDLMEGLGEEGCAACHEAPEPQAELSLRALTECTSCHGHHGVVRPSIAMLTPLPPTPCAFCHEGPGSLDETSPEPEAERERYLALRDRLVAEAGAQGLAGVALFDRLVELAPRLEPHTEGRGAESDRQQHAGFKRLFRKFRLGATTYVYDEPVTGKPVVAEVMRCSHCHAAEPLLADEPVGLQTAASLVEGLRQVAVLTARAERVLARAKRGGVETRAAAAALDGAVDASVELEVLVHAFDTGQGSEFEKVQGEGLAKARTALTVGYAALGELTYRRRGLGVFLAFVVLVLVGLGFKIRSLS